MEIKFKDGIKLGAAVYIGWSFAGAVSMLLTETEWFKKVEANNKERRAKRAQQMNPQPSDTDRPKAKIIGVQIE